MPTVCFTRNLQRHVDVRDCDAAGQTVRELLDAAFSEQPAVRSCVLVDQGMLRKHMSIFVDGEPIHDRVNPSDSVTPLARIDVIQSLSGG